MGSKMQRIGAIEGRNQALLFVILAYLFSYSLVTLCWFSGGRLSGVSGLVMLVGYMFVPLIVSVLLQKLVCRKPLKELEISPRPNRWFLVAWLLPLLLAFLTFGISLILPGVQYSPGMEGMLERYKDALTPEQLELIKRQIEGSPIHPVWIAVVEGLIAGITINAVAGFGEELGWRGFLPKQLGYMGFWRSSLVIGVVWGFWHAPLIIQGYNYPQHPIAGVFMMTVFTTLLSPIFSYVRLRAKSVIAAAIIHGTLNATYGVSIMLVKGGDDLTVGVMGLAGFIALALMNLGLLGYERKTKKILLA